MSATESSAGSDRHTAVDLIAGFLAAASLVFSLFALADRPVRFSSAAILMGLVAARMSTRFERLGMMAAFAGGAAWVIGLTLAVITENSLW